MKVGDIVELTFLDHVEVGDIDVSVPSKRHPMTCTVWGEVLCMGKREGVGFVEVVMWKAAEANSKTAVILYDTIQSQRVLK